MTQGIYADLVSQDGSIERVFVFGPMVPRIHNPVLARVFVLRKWRSTDPVGFGTRVQLPAYGVQDASFVAHPAWMPHYPAQPVLKTLRIQHPAFGTHATLEIKAWDIPGKEAS